MVPHCALTHRISLGNTECFFRSTLGKIASRPVSSEFSLYLSSLDASIVHCLCVPHFLLTIIQSPFAQTPTGVRYSIPVQANVNAWKGRWIHARGILLHIWLSRTCRGNHFHRLIVPPSDNTHFVGPIPHDYCCSRCGRPLSARMGFIAH